jgi:phytoene dehydrogenase-like protein
MSDEDADVIVVGAGLAGLRAAQVLNDAGRQVILIEADDHVGGRLSSRTVDGFVLDEGFQLINPAYPELVATGVMSHFDLRRFASAVRFSDGTTTHEIGDPRENPWHVISALRHPHLSLRDALTLARLLAEVRTRRVGQLLRGPDTSTRAALAARGLSAGAIDDVLTPFLRGTLLDDALDTSWHYTELVLKSFTRGRPGTHPHGIAALPAAMAAALTATTVRLNERALNIAGGGVETDIGRYLATAVVVATDATSAHRLLDSADVAWRAQTTWWWSVPVLSHANQLRIDTRRGFLSSALDLSSVAPERAPAGRSLVAASANGLFEGPSDAGVREDVARLFALSTRDVTLIERTVVPRSLPSVTTPLDLQRGQLIDDVVVAGDYLQTPSIQGALVSGRRAARLVLRRLAPA